MSGLASGNPQANHQELRDALQVLGVLFLSH
jgi:hypothetical protein